MYEIYGRFNVKYSSTYFKHFSHNNDFFSFVIKEKGIIKKVIIDFADTGNICQQALEWCDVYGKINLEEKDIGTEKVMCIGPSFGIQIYSLPFTLWYAGFNCLKSFNRIPNIKKFLSDYKAQWARSKITEYNQISSKQNFVYFISSIWKKELKTNKLRENFIISCRENEEIDFEGGFAPRSKNDIKGYEEITVESRVTSNYYIKKMSESALAFNTPSVFDCHGWKLAEFLCLGKAIVSTPLSRKLPKDLIDNRDFLITDGSINDITEKVNKIILNKKMKKVLELNSKKYFDNYLAPKIVIKKLLENY